MLRYTEKLHHLMDEGSGGVQEKFRSGFGVIEVGSEP
jgi:hypothetical protein